MTEKETSGAATPKKGKSPTKAKKPKTAPSHPKVSEMVNSAIKSLKERGGSSLVAIKKYITANYKVDAEKLSPFIKKYLKSAVVSGGLVQTKGKGANGSFRMGGSVSGKAVKSPAKAKKPTKKPKVAKTSTAPKKVAKPKKSPQKSKPKKAPAKKSKPVAKAAAKKTKPAAKKKPAKASPKKKAASKKGKK